LRRVVSASVAMGLVVLVVSNLSAAMHGVELPVRVVGSLIAGGLTFVAVVVLLGRQAEVRRRRARTRPAPPPPSAPVLRSRLGPPRR
jgi:hypothetical protein